MLKILVTGSNGQLGNSIRLLEKQYPDFDFIFTDVDELDISDQNQIDQFFQDKRPDYLINCAAYTAVDKAETDYELALLLNRDACTYLANACKTYNSCLIHISTDFVFDGTNKQPYSDVDKPNPMSAYGKSKLAGEEQIQQILEDSIIIRTAWLYSEFGNNFVKTMMKYGKEIGVLKVVNDQIGCPTYATDLASVILEMINQKCYSWGIFHFSNEGVISWYDFAVEIISLSAIKCDVFPIPSEEFPTPATRPAYSVLDKSRMKRDYSLHIPNWRDSLKKCIDNINS